MSEDNTKRDEMLQGIVERAAAMAGESIEQSVVDKLTGVIDEKMDSIKKERKLKFTESENGPLAGTKFARAGASPDDVQFAHDLLSRSGKPVSDQLRGVVADLKTRAMGTAQSGSGDEMIADTLYGSEMWGDARAESRVASLIRTFPMQGPVQTLPVRAAFPTPILAAELTGTGATVYAAQDINSNRVTVTAKKILFHAIWPTELEEDSLFPLIPFIRSELNDALAFHLDALCLRGDTTDAASGNINSDDADPAATTWFLAWDGIAHIPLVSSTGLGVDASTALTYAKLTDLRSKVYDPTYYLDWGHPNSPGDFVYVADPQTVDEISNLDEVVTVDKFGSAATVLTGQVARIGANPLISSAAFGRAEADGKMSSTATNNTLGRVVAFNRNGFVLGMRRMPMFEADTRIDTDQAEIVMSIRAGFGIHSPTGAIAGAKQAAALYNI